MLRTLLLAACFGSTTQEWVEISQTHYKKPAHFPTNTEERIFYPAETTSEGIRTNFYSSHEDIITEAGRYRPNFERPFDDEELVKFPDKTAYPNRSIAEHKWHQDEYRPGNIKRVNNGGKPRANITPEFSIEVFGEVTEHIPALVTVTEHHRKDQQTVLATIEKVPNKGSVKRVQLANTPVKSPSIDKFNPVRRNDVNHGFISMESDEFDIKPDMFKDTHSNAETTTNIRRVFSTTEVTLWKYERSTPAWPGSESTVTFQRHPQTITSDNIRPQNHQNKAKIIKINHYSTTTDKSITEENMVTKDSGTESPNGMYLEDKRSQNTKVTDTNINNVDDVTEKASIQSNFKDNGNIKIKSHEIDPNKPLITKLNDEKPGTDSKKTNEETKVNTLENVMKFLKVVTDTISKNTRRGVNGKVKYLNELKDTLLNSIKDRIDATWPDEGRPRGRRARSAEARGHVEFPSSESSLMTISFLTFAVFLIKLVLQVIQTYKHKTMMVAPVVVATAARQLRNT